MTRSASSLLLALVALVAAGRASALPTLDRDECLPLAVPEMGVGVALDAADWDGDARAELAAGSPYWTDPKFETSWQGVLHVYGLPGADPWNIERSSYGNVPNARRGSTVVSGDFDGDGTPEFATGAPEALGGQVFVLTPSGTLAFVLSQDASDVGGGSEPGDYFGSALAVGNFDDDLYDDLAVGVHGESWSGADGDHQGAVQVFFGSENGLDGARDLLFGQDSFSGQTREDVDSFGRVLAAGDFDGDGYDDLAIGVPDEDEGSEVDSGIVHVVFGSSTGLDFTRQQNWSQSTVGIAGGAEAGDRFGASLAIGSFDGVVFEPERLDLAIGVPGEAEGAVPGAGAVHILFSDGDGPDALGSQFLLRPGGSLHDSDFGLSLHAADLDGDDLDDLLVGSGIVAVAPPGFEEEGEVYLYLGRFSNPMVFSGRKPWTAAENACAETGSRAHDMGRAITTGDFDGDGALDLALGIAEWYPDDPLEVLGAAVVIYGALFADGFDTGDPSRWTVPAPPGNP